MIANGIIIAIIFLWAVFVIRYLWRRHVNARKSGTPCCAGCSNCTGKRNCSRCR